MRIFGRPREITTSPASHETLEHVQGKLAEAEKERDDLRRALSELRPLRCSFCGKSQHDVKKLIAGPSVLICNECVDICVDVVRENSPTTDEGRGT